MHKKNFFGDSVSKVTFMGKNGLTQQRKMFLALKVEGKMF